MSTTTETHFPAQIPNLAESSSLRLRFVWICLTVMIVDLGCDDDISLALIILIVPSARYAQSEGKPRDKLNQSSLWLERVRKEQGGCCQPQPQTRQPRNASETFHLPLLVLLKPSRFSILSRGASPDRNKSSSLAVCSLISLPLLLGGSCDCYSSLHGRG